MIFQQPNMKGITVEYINEKWTINDFQIELATEELVKVKKALSFFVDNMPLKKIWLNVRTVVTYNFEVTYKNTYIYLFRVRVSECVIVV